MTANVEGMIRAGIDAYRGGNKAEARAFLEKAIELDEYNEDAWMWLSAVVETPDEQRTCLENVLVINPSNEKAQQGLKMLGVDTLTDITPANDTASSDVEASSTPAFIGSDFDETDDDDEDWLTVPPTASSSASATFQGEDLNSNDYDDWVAGLNLGGEDEPTTSAPVEEDTGFNLDEVDNMFGSDDLFGDDELIVQPTSAPTDDASIISGPFGGGDDFGVPTFDDEATETEPIPKTPAKTPILSPAAENVDSLSFAESGIDDLLMDESDLVEDHSEYIGGDFVTADHVSQSSYEDLTAEQYFSYIPKNIKATRLPGTNEGSSMVLILGVVLLLILNIAAGVFLALSLGG